MAEAVTSSTPALNTADDKMVLAPAPIEISGSLILGGSAGSAGQVLTSQGDDAEPTWETPIDSGATWGNIVGTLSNQTDLDTALGTAGETALWGSISGDVTDQTDVIDAINDAIGTAGETALWGSITGTLGDQTDVSGAIGAKADASNPSLSGTISAANNFVYGLGDSGTLANSPTIRSTTGNNTQARVTANATGTGNFATLRAYGSSDINNSNWVLIRSTGDDTDTVPPAILWGKTSSGTDANATKSLVFQTQQGGSYATRYSLHPSGTPTDTTDLTTKTYVDTDFAPKASPTFSGDVTFSTASNKLIINGTTIIESSVTNGNTFLNLRPNGTGNRTHALFADSSDLTDYTYLRVGSSGSGSNWWVGPITAGSGTAKDCHYAGGNAKVGMVIDTNGNVAMGASQVALATTATDGFLYIPTCAGVPTGVPTSITGKAPMVVDSSNNKLYVYVGGAWVAMN